MSIVGFAVAVDAVAIGFDVGSYIGTPVWIMDLFRAFLLEKKKCSSVHDDNQKKGSEKAKEVVVCACFFLFFFFVFYRKEKEKERSCVRSDVIVRLKGKVKNKSGRKRTNTRLWTGKGNNNERMKKKKKKKEQCFCTGDRPITILPFSSLLFPVPGPRARVR